VAVERLAYRLWRCVRTKECANLRAIIEAVVTEDGQTSMRPNSGAPIWGRPPLDRGYRELPERAERLSSSLTEEQQKFLKSRQLGLYRNTRYAQADSLRRAGDFAGALDIFLRVAWLDRNGPCNALTMNGVPVPGSPGFQRRENSNNAPALMLEIARGAITLGLDSQGLGTRFAECALYEIEVTAPLRPIVSTDEAWGSVAREVSVLIANGGLPITSDREKVTNSIYDHRDKSAYGDSKVDSIYSENPYILKWWTASHDELLIQEIREKQWAWPWHIRDKIVAITPPGIIDTWKSEDPICSTFTGDSQTTGGKSHGFRFAWYNVLMYFARSRAEKLALTDAVKRPEWRRCPLCGKTFVEDSLPMPLIERLGINQLDFCSPCLSDSLFQNQATNDSASQGEIKAYLRDLAGVLGRIPSQNFGEGMYDLWDLNTDERLAVLRVLQRKPTLRRVKELYGSWFKALIDAELLENGARRTSIGTQCLAKDGHMCFSLGEKTIDDLLHVMGIPHEREPVYPESNYRADFIVAGVFIEYFGLTGDADYDAKSREKQRLCRTHGIKLISVFPKDLVNSRKLESILLAGLGLPGHRSERLPDRALHDASPLTAIARIE
jgi:hypothetical protein